MRRLIVIAGKADPAELELDLTGEREVFLGRAAESDLRLYDETASRRHASVREGEGRTLLVDLDSANGVLLNGDAVPGRAALFDGDEIQIGDVRLRYLVGGGSDRETVVVDGGEDVRIEAAVDPSAADPAADVGARDAARRLRLVCDAAVACADASAYAEIPAVLLGLAVETFAPDRATVTLRGVDGGESVAAGYPTGASAPSSATLHRRVVENGEAVLVRDARDAERGSTARSMVASRYRSTLAAPLATAEGVLGFIALEAEAPDRFGEEDLRALAAVARQAALALRNLRTLSSARAEVDRLARASDESAAAETILGAHASMDAVRTLISKAAAVDTPVLVTGETGTGKELVARALHAGSPRRSQPFVALNCAALVEGLLESELFGHEKGAFTGADAKREGRILDAGSGTLLLDEVGELPPGLQAKLLRVLSEGTFTRVGGRKTLKLQCRIVAATNRDLAAEVEAGTFRRDLYHRLAVLTIHLPPLRDRGGDVELIAEAALERIAARLAKLPPRLAADARTTLRAYAWPGNVRELFNVLERALVLLEGDTITALDLPLDTSPAAGSREETPGEVLTIREAEKRAVKAALSATGGKKGKAAELLGISWPTLNRKIREYGLQERTP